MQRKSTHEFREGGLSAEQTNCYQDHRAWKKTEEDTWGQDMEEKCSALMLILLFMSVPSC